MKQITITFPDNCELKQDGNTYTIVEKEKKLTYEYIAKELFANKPCFYVATNGEIGEATKLNSYVAEQLNNSTSKKQAEKLLAINKLMNVAKYLNDGWQPGWDYIHEDKYFIAINSNEIYIEETLINYSAVYFKSKELAQQAIEILGEETIKLALCTDY